MDGIRDRIIQYMHDKVGIEWEKIPDLRHQYLLEFNTTLMGLKHHYDIDEKDYLSYVHDLKLEDYLRYDRRINDLLENYPQKKVIFTNADNLHARKILNFFQIGHHFEIIINFYDLIPFVKPHPDAFLKSQKILKISNWDGCLYLDDQLSNVLQAEAIGLSSILVDEEMKSSFPKLIPSILELPRYLKPDRNNKTNA